MNSEVIAAIFVIVMISSWIGNFVKLADCDFEAPYKCEIIHGIGVVPAAAVVTVWMDDDSD